MRPSDADPMLTPDSFGRGGAGGQQAFADARHRVGFGYVTNQMSAAAAPVRAVMAALSLALG